MVGRVPVCGSPRRGGAGGERRSITSAAWVEAGRAAGPPSEVSFLVALAYSTQLSCYLSCCQLLPAVTCSAVTVYGLNMRLFEAEGSNQ